MLKLQQEKWILGNNTQTETTETNEKKSPKTGDPANFIYLATLAGSALTGIRRKFKK